jgi:DNA polymerase III sliding clamp (beta) subunit (PCNA family)
MGSSTRSNSIMIELNKKQVGALLKVIPKLDSRPLLDGLRVTQKDGQWYAIATNGYVLVILHLDNDTDGIKEGTIRQDAIERWHRLATGKNRLTTHELINTVWADDYAHHNSYAKNEYPDMFALLEAGEAEIEATPKLTFNAEYMKLIQDITNKPVTYTLHGTMKPMVARDEGNTYVLMPIKG